MFNSNATLQTQMAIWLGLVSWCVVTPGLAFMWIFGRELGEPGEWAALLVVFAVHGSFFAAALGFQETVRMLRAESYERHHLYLALAGLLLGLSGCSTFLTAIVLG